MDDLDDVRRRLAARQEDCFGRIDDAVSELLAVHHVDGDDILARVKAAIDTENDSLDEWHSHES